ncbi:signal peptidase I [Paenibacillus sp. GP183]|uniref:signal peptidase I n=1 Tax=Paenibacillus sp. GP183 TaxID=1882751 RepID=UPI0008996E99|nr:signal peptidase I [Paenibacillus sp. GP183]SEB79694.1 signal peptidase, endoplasmic reticulum-type [Paenibacillus sp. GP183]
MKQAVKWGSRTITVILAVFLLITVFCAASSRMSGGTPKILGLNVYAVLSGSMEPSIQVGSIILEKPNVNANSLKVGDVITFKASQDEFGGQNNDGSAILITHRIQAIKSLNGKLAFQTKGDSNDGPDAQLVQPANIIGQYNNIMIPYLGYYLNFMKTKLGIALLLILPGALLIVSAMVSLIREISKLQKKMNSATKTEGL